MSSTPLLIDAKPSDGYTVHVRFEDGLTADVDLSYLLDYWPNMGRHHRPPLLASTSCFGNNLVESTPSLLPPGFGCEPNGWHECERHSVGRDVLVQPEEVAGVVAALQRL
jgi:hypothetical protein